MARDSGALDTISFHRSQWRGRGGFSPHFPILRQSQSSVGTWMRKYAILNASSAQLDDVFLL
jgi:hypothetical protein